VERVLDFESLRIIKVHTPKKTKVRINAKTKSLTLFTSIVNNREQKAYGQAKKRACEKIPAVGFFPKEETYHRSHKKACAYSLEDIYQGFKTFPVSHV